MPFSGSGTGIQNADDVFFSGLSDGETLQYDSATAKWNNSTATVGYTVESDGVPLAARSKLNFVGTGVSVTDDAANDKTTVTVLSAVTAPVGFYGSAANMDSVGNLQIGGTSSGEPNTWAAYRFVATETGDLNAVRIYWIDETHPGYGGGTGGTIRISVEEDDGSGDGPQGWYESGGARAGTGSALATVDVVSPNDGLGATHTFTTPATLVAGTTYYVTFSNVDVDPVTNFVSVDCGWIDSATTGVLTPRQPRYPNNIFGAVTKKGANEWAVRSEATPIINFQYASGSMDGFGFYEVLKASTGTQIAGPNNLLRQTLTPTRSLSASGGKVRIALTSGSGDLTVTLRDSGGTALGSFTVPAADVTLQPDPTEKSAGHWVGGDFAAPISLTSGADYTFELTTPSGTVMWSRPIKSGFNQWGDDTSFREGKMEYSTNGGASWSDSFTVLGDMQFYLVEVSSGSSGSVPAAAATPYTRVPIVTAAVGINVHLKYLQGTTQHTIGASTTYGRITDNGTQCQVATTWDRCIDTGLIPVNRAAEGAEGAQYVSVPRFFLESDVSWFRAAFVGYDSSGTKLTSQWGLTSINNDDNIAQWDSDAGDELWSLSTGDSSWIVVDLPGDPNLAYVRILVDSGGVNPPWTRFTIDALAVNEATVGELAIVRQRLMERPSTTADINSVRNALIDLGIIS